MALVPPARSGSGCLYSGRLHRLIPLSIGALLFVAAILKYHELATEPVAESTLWTSRWFLVGSSDLELILGLWLFAGAWARASRAFGIMCFAVFAQVALYRALAGELSCGCFGKVPVSPWYTLLVDVAALFALFAWRPAGRALLSDHDTREPSLFDAVPRTPLSDADANPRPRNAGRLTLRFAGVVLLFLLLGGTSFVVATYQPGTSAADGTFDESASIVLLEPEKWVGKPAPILKHIDIGKELATGTWLVVLYHHDCPKCQEALPRYESLARNSGDTRVALIAVPPYGDGNLAVPESRCRLGFLQPVKRWFVTTPAEIIVHDGIVVPPASHPTG
jgi:hypothetical protein